jgi:sulfite exporter TauE/SafE
MNSALVWTAALMGLAGGPHCLAMCGAACLGLGQAAAPRSTQALLLFQFGRVLGYGLLGALAASSLQGLGWLSVHSAALRPVWSLIHVAAMLLGLLLLWRAEQPLWLQGTARSVWARVRTWNARWQLRADRGTPLVMGVLWALLPCGLLYSALMVAALAGGALEGALVMVAFVAGSALVLWWGPWLWLKLGRQGPGGWGTGSWGVRLAGLTLALTSGWALWMGLVHDQAPWCVTP